MNGLFIGPYRQNDGWGMASRDYIKAISTQIPNLTTRPIYFTNNTIDIESDISKHEKILSKNYDIVFQKTLPHCLAINKSIKKNVALFVLETNDISNSSCINNLNQIDEICVPSSQEEKCLKLSGVTTPIKVVSEPINTDFYNTNRNHKIDLPKNIEKSFKFYTIGEFVERKNFLDLITAFHLAFEPTDNVSLVIKTHRPGSSSADSLKYIQQVIYNHKRKLNIRQIYQQEILICDRLSDLDMIGLHNACDCFVMPSCGEAFCRPAAEALVLGKTPIVTDNTGMIDFINNTNGFVVNSRKQPVILEERTLSNDFDIYNAYEYWYKPNIYSLIESMQKIYQMSKKDKETYKAKQQNGINSIQQFSYETIGQKICI
jgi:glycosyltransferase involved in cell wall biosynthesis